MSLYAVQKYKYTVEKRLEQYFTKDIQIPSKHIERCPLSLEIRNIPITTIKLISLQTQKNSSHKKDRKCQSDSRWNNWNSHKFLVRSIN